ncbi:Alpha-ketoglutarate-dependent dioxygenase abh1 [Lachnellula arida]|uniref:Alpha-ketoglutarate-dependent dioxygenase abh1 n=1 Tax=Lachnellula arida TaxID=1316785 RepID=A0A8T9BS44_9HELO|nr:Alpha-ketoglutarate-dependent dioxygenase abh1 [Lachnellula arida]
MGSIADTLPNPERLDPHEAPPQKLKEIYKSWTGATAITPERLKNEVLDTESLQANAGTGTEDISPEVLGKHFGQFLVNNAFQTDTSEGSGSGNASLAVSTNDINMAALKATAHDIKKIPGEEAFSLFLSVALQDIPSHQSPISKEFSTKLVFYFTKPHLLYLFYLLSDSVSGLMVFPSLLPPSVQQSLLSGLLHRELSNPENQTNLHLHHTITYPPSKASFFSTDPEDCPHLPKDHATHKPLSNRAVLEKSLHWVTLGGQYDWTNKEYPKGTPPTFPPPTAHLIYSLFPYTTPQAAILNIYTPKDKLSLHRDVSEAVDRGLVSISLGCSALFVIGLRDKTSGELHHETILLRSGDVLYMDGESRYAWHGVPKILQGTCPGYLQSWPGKNFPAYEGWMGNRRINLNVRQMFE